MTISGTIPARVSFNCDGVTKVFPIPIQAYQNTDITVVLTAPAAGGGGEVVLAINSDYSLVSSGTLQPPAWTLTTLAANAYASGYTLQAFINPVQAQQSQYVQGQAFPSLAVQTNLDRLTQMVQRLQDQIGRVIHVPDGDVSPVMALPQASTRAGFALQFDSNGNIALGIPVTGNVTSAIVKNLLNTDPGSIGFGNLGLGYLALSSNGAGGTPGNNNTAFGYKALSALSGGASNPTGSTAVGYIALQNSNGATNTAIGDNCMASDLTGSDNTAVGAQALFSETNSTGNNCVGFQCGYFITTGNTNCLFGNYAGGGINGPTGVGITTGTANCGFGGGTLANVTTAGGNSAFGTGALGNTTGGANVAIGNFAGFHANTSSEFYLDNQDRGSNAAEIANAPIYGNFGADAGHNRLRFNAQLSASVGTLCSTNVAPTIASAAVIAPTAAITFVSGTTTVTGISVPSWMSNGGRITLIPTGVWAWTTAINIALAGTAVVNKALDFIWDAGTSKWYPSYVS